VYSDKVTKIFVKGCLASLLLTFPVIGEFQGGKAEISYKNADSLLNRLLAHPETRMKEIAPAESLFRETLAKYPEIHSILRTNSKGFIVNAIARTDENAPSGKDVSNEKYYSVPEKTLKPYHGAIVQIVGKNQFSLFCSKPIIVKNSLGVYRFGGVVAVHTSVVDSVRQKKDIVLTSRHEKKDTVSASSIEKQDTAAAIATVPSVAPPESDHPDQTVEDTLAVRKPLKGQGRIFIFSGLLVLIGLFVMAILFKGKTRAKRTGIGREVQDAALLSAPDAIVQSDAQSLALEINRAIEQHQVAAEVALPQEDVSLHLNVAIAHDDTIAVESASGTSPEGRVMPHEPPEASIEGPAPPTDSACPPEITTVINDAPENPGPDREEEARLKDDIRENLLSELKKEIVEKELNSLRNTVISELKTDIREKLENNEADAIREHLRQEMADVWRREIQETYHETFYREEIDNLRKIVREKLIEKEMPHLVKHHRTELSKEIRAKMEASFSDQIERHERNVMKAEIVKKLQNEEYPRMFQEEREKLRMSLMRQIAEKETETMEGFLRGELADQLRIQVQPEAESIRGNLRKEMAERIEREIVEREYEGMVAQSREALKERTQKEIETNELEAIHDELIVKIIEEERVRIMSEELGKIIEMERNRIADQEAPQLRDQIRLQLREQELDAMHARVKKEIYSETSQAIRETCEQEYNGLLEKKMVEYRDMIEKKLHAEIRKDLLTEYHTLTDDLEKLAGSLDNVEALDSLSRTITLLSDEKKKYKYFNLNSAQTESLLEYLKRVQSRFNIFLDKNDEALREMELKIRSVMNKLDSGS
jgi:hypothetical protein